MRIKNPFYDSPISIEMGPAQIMEDIARKAAGDIDNMTMAAVGRAGVNVDRDKLIQALQADRARYEEAYRRGWEDCMKTKHFGIDRLEAGTMLDTLSITKSTDELKELIKQHPDYPICVLAGEDTNSGDYPWMYCSDIRFSVGEILDCDFLDYDDTTFTDRDRVQEVVEEHFYDDGLEGEELDQAVKNMLESLEPYWKDAIFIWASN